MAQSVNLKARGLFTLQNTLSGIPEGSLSVADNVVIDRDGVIEPRRGIKLYGDVIENEDSAERAKQLIVYKNRLLRHYSTKLQVDNGSGTFTTLNNTDLTEASVTSLEGRIRSVEFNGNLYFTSDSGIRKISALTASTIATSPITGAGVPKALDITLALTSTGVLLSQYQAARYRVTWLFKDANSVLLESSPSGSEYVTNSSVTVKDVSITFSIPEGITENYAYRIYRSKIVTGTLTEPAIPDEELQLVYELNPTTGEIASGRITVTDSNTLLTGANLYVNPNSEQGLAQSNDLPPLATDLAVYKNTTFYSNTTSSHTLELALLGVSDIPNTIPTTSAGVVAIGGFSPGVGPSTTIVGVADTTNIVVGGKVRIVNCDVIPNGEYAIISVSAFAFEIAVPYVGALPSGTVVKVKPSASSETYSFLAVHNGMVDVTNIANSGGGNIAITVSDASNIAVDDTIYLNDVSGETTAANSYVVTGKLGNVITVVGTTSGYTSGGTITKYNPREHYYFMDDVEYPEIGIINRPTSVSIQANIEELTRSLIRTINIQKSGCVYAYSLGSDSLGQFYFEGRTLGSKKFYVYASHSALGNEFLPIISTDRHTTTSDNSAAPNRLYYSKYQQPESVPALNYQDIGPRDKAILRIAALRDGLFIFKEDGVYRLSGDSSNNFQITLFDSNVTIAASDSVSVLNNRIFLYANQGIAAISDTGAEIVSRDIENLIIPKVTHANFAAATFAFAYENDRSYFVFTTENESDTAATICYRLNTFTRTWTSLSLTKTCGVVSESRMYLGASDVPYIEQERKSLNRLDYADREYTISPPAGFVDGTTLYVLDITNTAVGDVVTQNQGVTISQFNRLLKLLDIDGAADSNYYASVKAVAGDSMRDRIVALSTKLNADANITAVDYPLPLVSEDTASDHITYFDEIVGKLNDDIALSLRYHYASTAAFEARITAVDTATGSITIDTAYDFLALPMYLYKAFTSTVTYAPQHFGDPSQLKHIYETTVLFEDITFSAAEMSYATDVSSGFIPVLFEGEGKGLWGSFSWGRVNWGGVGSARPFRTYMPKDKQRARFVIPKFTHSAALEKYSIFGISFTFELTSTRGYR